MSNEPQNPGGEDALDLSGLNFGPAWARDSSESKSLKKFKDRGDRSDPRDRRQGGGGRRQGGGGGGGRGRDDRRGDRKGGGRGSFKGGRRDDNRRPQRQSTPAPEGFKVHFMPSEESLDLLAKEVTQTGRTFSVFDLAKVLLQGRDRFRVTFEHPEQKFYRCREDNSIWLTRAEALRQLWRGDWLKNYYDSVEVEGEAPTGSYQAVARCGISGKYLGPPNYHAYQQNVNALHREQFANMPLERYKSKIVMERGEEAVGAWLESMKTTTQWKIASGKSADEKLAKEQAEEQAEEAPTADASQSSEGESSAGERPAEDASTEVEVAADEPTAAGEAPSGEAAEPAESSHEELFKTAAEVEQHFLANHFEAVFEETSRAWVMGDIQGKFLSPGLLTLLKDSVVEEKRYPANLMPIVCRQLSGRHVAVFKWNKKLKVGPSRPHAVPADMALAERPKQIIDYLSKKSGKKLEDFWKTVFADETTDEQKAEWYHDLHWLLNQGHAILLSDTTLHLAKPGNQDQPPAKKAAQREESKKEASPKAEAVPAEESMVDEGSAQASEPSSQVAENPEAAGPVE
ncbi:MAG: hypothetical protein ACON5H_03830 [Akkermansiaceae bacterium]